MPVRPRITLSKEELKRAKIPTNHVLVKLIYRSEGLMTKGGIVVGFNEDTNYAEDDSYHVSDIAEIYAEVVKVPEKLFFDKTSPQSMDWECAMELEAGDIVWTNALESKNANEIHCDKEVYRSIPYADLYVAKRTIYVNSMKVTVNIPLNGYVLCSPAYNQKVSYLDVTSKDTIDKTRGVIAYIGNPVKQYLRDAYCDIEDLRVGDEVLFAPKTPLFWLERNASLAKFDGNNLFWVVKRYRIALVINRKDENN